jgi:hypothetical protein
MPERLGRAQVNVGEGIVVMPWKERDWLLREIRSFDSARRIIRAFEAVGASRPLKLDDTDELELYDMIFRLAARPAGYDTMPGSVRQLRAALDRKLHPPA